MLHFLSIMRWLDQIKAEIGQLSHFKNPQLCLSLFQGAVELSSWTSVNGTTASRPRSVESIKPILSPFDIYFLLTWVVIKTTHLFSFLRGFSSSYGIITRTFKWKFIVSTIPTQPDWRRTLLSDPVTSSLGSVSQVLRLWRIRAPQLLLMVLSLELALASEFVFSCSLKTALYGWTFEKYLTAKLK